MELLFIPQTDVWPRSAVFLCADMIMIKERKISQGGRSLQRHRGAQRSPVRSLSVSERLRVAAGGTAPTSTMEEAEGVLVDEGPDISLRLGPSVCREQVSS